MQIEIDTPQHMAELGAQIARELKAGDLVALNGELGAGKTTLTRGLGDELGVRGSVTSPTFVLARTHRRIGGEAPLVHVDAYRLGSAAELDDLDIDWSASIVVVEWAAGMLDGVAEHWIEIDIRRPMGASVDVAAVADIADGEEPVEPRVVTITGHGSRWRDLRLI